MDDTDPTTAARRRGARAESPPAEHGDGPLVVWRTWLIKPDGPKRDTILTGLNGFRWLEPEMDAKCVLQERVPGDVRPGTRTVDRHHDVIPAAHCSCGIYAGRDELVSQRHPLPPSRTPYATGFVKLSGRILIAGDTLRAQHATMIGPITLLSGRRPWWHRALPARLAARPPRVLTDRDRFRTVWTEQRVGEVADRWLQHTAATLVDRYRVGVLLPYS